jgi:N-formylglutamate amidohydrolase
VIPPRIRQGILLSDLELELELRRMTDSHTDEIARVAANQAATRPWVFKNGLSRLVMDPERFIDGTEEMDQCGMGAIYTKTSSGEQLRDLTPGERESLIAEYFSPYAHAFANLVDQVLADRGQVTIIDIHSYPQQALPYELHSTDPRPAMCLGIDETHTPKNLQDAAAEAFKRFGDIGFNTPFAGTYVPLKHYQSELRVRSIMLEIRRDIYMDEATGEGREADIAALGECLGQLLNTIASLS